MMGHSVCAEIAALAAAVQDELDRVSQTLTGRIRQLADRYASPLPQLVDGVEKLAARVDSHLKRKGCQPTSTAICGMMNNRRRSHDPETRERRAPARRE